MKTSILHLALFCLLAPSASFAQDVAKDSLFVRYFGTADYRASMYNYSVTEDKSGILYFANESGVLEYDGSRWIVHTIPGFANTISVKMHPDGKLYVGGRNQFGYMERDSLGDLQYVSLRELIDPEKELNEVWQITFFKGQVYFQTYEALIRFDGELCYDTNIKNSWVFHQDDDLYISIFDGGLAKLKGDSLQYLNKSIKLEKDNPQETLPYRGKEKILVTEYNGLYLIDTTNMKTRKWDVPANEDLMTLSVWDAMTWDDSTYLFSTIRGGLRWMNKKGEIVRKLDMSNGLKSHDIYSFNRDALGNLWLNGAGIHHIIFPEKSDYSKTGALIRQLKIDSTHHLLNCVDSVIHTPFDPQTIAFQFTTPGVDKADVQYSYKLEGFNENWSRWVDEPSKEYTNLAGGEYTFKVRSKLLNGNELSEASVSLVIPVEWYNKPWSKVAGGLLIWLMVVGIYKLRTKHLKTQNRKLESLIDQRTGELRYANEELLKRNYELDQFVRRVSHDLVAPIKSVKGLMGIARMEEEKAEQEKCFDMIELSLSKQENFVSKLLDQAINYKEVNTEMINFYDFCQDLIQDLSSYNGAEDIQVLCEVSKNQAIETDPIRLRIVLRNLLENAIKYRKLQATDSSVTIRGTEEEKNLRIEVEDNGIGIAEDHFEQIFSMFKRVTDQRYGAGLGLYIVKDVVSSLNGKIEIESKLGEGTKFILTFPLKK